MRSQSPRRVLERSLHGAFGHHVEEVVFDRFPDGLYVVGRRATAHNVWRVAMSAALREVGVEVSVVVLPDSDRFE